MNQPPIRFRLLDAMILIGAAACGLALAKWGYGEAFTTPMPPYIRGLQVHGFVVFAAYPLTFAVVVLRLLRARPRRRRLCSQPGFVACSTVVIVASFNLSIFSTHHFLLDADSNYKLRDVVISSLGFSYTSPAVLAAWMLLAIGGRWRAERSWIDRLGRILGVFWLMPFLILEIVQLTG